MKIQTYDELLLLYDVVPGRISNAKVRRCLTNGLFRTCTLWCDMVFVIGLNHEYGAYVMQEYVMQEAFEPNTPQKNDLLYTEFVNSDSDPVSL